MTLGQARKERGTKAERKAEIYLERHGLKLIERNYSCRNGEIDLVMQDKGALVFVEVRFREASGFISPAETVTVGKQKKIIAAARHFLHSHRQHNQAPCRFDVLAISGPLQENISWIRDAFQPAG